MVELNRLLEKLVLRCFVRLPRDAFILGPEKTRGWAAAAPERASVGTIFWKFK